MNLNYVFGHGDKSKKIMYQIIYVVLVGLQLCCNCLICTMYCSLRPAKNQKQLLLLAYLFFSKLSDQIQLVSQPFNNSIPLMLMDQFQLIQKLQVYLVINLFIWWYWNVEIKLGQIKVSASYSYTMLQQKLFRR